MTLSTYLIALLSSKGLPKTKLTQDGILRQETFSWRDEDGTDRGGERAAIEHGQGT